MDKGGILSEIRRTASENGGVALGVERFEAVTGITEGMWRGKYWRRWGDAVREAGLTENKLIEGYAHPFLVLCLVTLARNNGRFPTYADLKMERATDSAFPTHMVFSRMGALEERIRLVRAFITANPEYSDVAEYLPRPIQPSGIDLETTTSTPADGFVYMVSLGKHYKIGKTFSIPRRHREIALELPEKPNVVHSIRTDDPTGIEAYWHKRFEAKRTNGEWFALTREDVRAFKRRKFM